MLRGHNNCWTTTMLRNHDGFEEAKMLKGHDSCRKGKMFRECGDYQEAKNAERVLQLSKRNHIARQQQ